MKLLINRANIAKRGGRSKKSLLEFGTKKRYNYKKNEHHCHFCKKSIKGDLQLHHHAGNRAAGGKETTPVHAKCHQKQTGNYNHILTTEDRRKAGLKTYQSNLRNQKNFVARRPSLGNFNNQSINGNTATSANRPQVESR